MQPRLTPFLNTWVLAAIAWVGASPAAWAWPLTASTSVCDAPDETSRYVLAPLRSEQAGGPDEGSIRIFYRLYAPLDAAKPTLLIIPGGPGADHSLLFSFAFLADRYNLVSFDHRGVGCTKVLSSWNATRYEPGIFSMARASDDLEAIRQDLLGTNGSWSVYGVSYGGMLAQKYAIQHPTHVSGLILDSTMHDTRGTALARDQYVKLFVDEDAEVSSLYRQILARDPEARPQLLQRIFRYAYSYQGRTQGIRNFFKQVAAAPDLEEMRRRYRAKPPAPVTGMFQAIACEEIWDYPERADDSFMPDLELGCRAFKPFRSPMAFSEDLKNLPMRAMIWGGAYDPVTPIAMMREIRDLLPNALMFENPHAGHGVISEKYACAQKLLRSFLAGAPWEATRAISQAPDCQSAPSMNLFEFPLGLRLLGEIHEPPRW